MNSRIATAFEELFKNADKLTNDESHALFKKLAELSPKRPGWMSQSETQIFDQVTDKLINLYQVKKMPIVFRYEMAKILLDKQHDFKTVKKVFNNYLFLNSLSKENYIENYENIIKFLSQYKQFNIQEDWDFGYQEINKVVEKIYKFLQVRCMQEKYIESKDAELQRDYSNIEIFIKKIAVLKNAGVKNLKYDQNAMLFLAGIYSHLLIKNASIIPLNRQALLEIGKNKCPLLHKLLIQLNQVFLNTNEIFEETDAEWLKKLVSYNAYATYKYHFSYSDLTIDRLCERGAYWNCKIQQNNQPSVSDFEWEDTHLFSIVKTNKSLNQLPPIPPTYYGSVTRSVANYQATTHHPNSSQYLIHSVDENQSLPGQQPNIKNIYALIRFLCGEASKVMPGQFLVMPASLAIYEFNDQVTTKKDRLTDKPGTRSVKCITKTLLNDHVPPLHFNFDEHHLFIPVLVCNLGENKTPQKQITYLCADLRSQSLLDEIKMQFLDAMSLPNVKKTLEDSYSSVTVFEKTILEKFKPHVEKLFEYINSTGNKVSFDIDFEQQRNGYKKIIIQISKADKTGQLATGTLMYDLNELLSQVYKDKNNLTLGELMAKPDLYLGIHTSCDELLAKLDLAFRFDVTRLLGLDDLIIKMNEALLVLWKIDAANTFSPISLSATEPLVLSLRVPLANNELQTITISNIEKCFDRMNLTINHDAILQSMAMSLANLFMQYVKSHKGLPSNERLIFWTHCRDIVAQCHQQFSKHGVSLDDEDFYKRVFNQQMIKSSGNAENAPPPPVDLPSIIQTSKPCKIVLR